MNNQASAFWETRIRKENAAIQKMMQASVHTDGGKRAAAPPNSVAFLLSQGPNSTQQQQREGAGSSRVSALTATSAGSKPQAEQPAIPVALPSRENRKLRLLPQVPAPPDAALKKIPLSKDVLEERTFQRLMEEAAARRLAKRKELDPSFVPPTAAAGPADAAGKKQRAKDEKESVASARSSSSHKSRGSSAGKQGSSKVAVVAGSAGLLAAAGAAGNPNTASSSSGSQVGKWVTSVPSALPPIQSARGSAAGSESAFSATTLSHHAASSALVSGVTSINQRLEAIESKLEGEKELRNDLRRALMEVRQIVEKARLGGASAGSASAQRSNVSGAASSSARKQQHPAPAVM